MHAFWSIFYWSTFAFSYLVVPFMSAYEDSGEIIVKKKVVSALLYVGATYAIYAVIGVICLLFLWFNGNFSSKGFSLEGLLMALGCVYGLI